MNILFTSVGRRVELIRAFRRAYQSLGLSGKIVATDADALAPALQVVDRAILVPRSPTPEFVPALLEICQSEAVDLVLPLIDPDISILAGARGPFDSAGVRLAVVSPDAADIAADKWKTTQFFQGLALSTPRSWLPPDLPSSPPFPLYIKPRRGSAAQHSYRLDSVRELDYFLDVVPDPIIQECLPGPEITSDVTCDLDGDLLGIVSRQRIEVRWGEVAKGVTVHRPDIQAACARVARALPAVGPITVQCMLKEDVPHFTEINARLGGGTPLGIAAGVDGPLWLLARAAGLRVEIPPLGTYRVGLYLSRFDDSFFLDEADLDRTTGRGPKTVIS